MRFGNRLQVVAHLPDVIQISRCLINELPHVGEVVVFTYFVEVERHITIEVRVVVVSQVVEERFKSTYFIRGSPNVET